MKVTQKVVVTMGACSSKTDCELPEACVGVSPSCLPRMGSDTQEGLFYVQRPNN